MNRVQLVAAAMLCLVLGLSPQVFGGPFRLMGYDTLAMGQGGTEGAWGTGLGVMYSNPALLTDVDEGFGLSFFFFQPDMTVKLMSRPANADIPISFYDSDAGIAESNVDRPLPTAELRMPRANNRASSLSTQLGIGIAHSLGIEDFRMGLAVLVPSSGLTNISAMYPDEREQYFTNTVHFTRFGEWSQVLSLLMGAAYRPFDWFSFGATVEGGLNVGATLDMYIPEATVQDHALVNAAFNAKPTARLVVGFNFRPMDWLSFGLVWRDRRYSKVDADAYLNLWNYHEAGNETVPKRVYQRHLMALDFEPQEVSLSVGARMLGLTGQLSATWNHWADYLGTHHQRAQETAVWEPGAPKDSRFAFSDTFSLVLGLRYEYLDGFTLTAGGGWHPSPVPAQVGRTNYADSDLFNAALGHRVDVDLRGRTLRIDVGLQFWSMVKTTVHKDPSLIKDEFPDDARTLIGGQPMPEAIGLQTNNPGFPGYSFEGNALAGSVSLSYLF